MALSEGWLIKRPEEHQRKNFETLSTSMGSGESSSIAVAKTGFNTASMIWSRRGVTSQYSVNRYGGYWLLK